MHRPSGEDHLQAEGRAKRSLLDDPALHNPWLILGLLFLVTGALGLPVLWISRAFSTEMKIALSIIVLIYTALLLCGTWLIVAWSYGRVVNAF